MITSFIPTYKRPDQLKKAIESILAQTHNDLQLVVLDNASGDDTEAVVRSYMKKDSRVKYHCHAENLGMLGNYAYAFDNLETPYFNILSDDDYVHPDFLETAFRDMEDFPDIAFCACAIEALNTEGVCIGNSIEGWQKEGYYAAGEGALEMTKSHGRFPMPTGVLFRTELVQEIKPQLTPKMQLMWDPDYLTQIAARHPISINKKKCGIFIAHDEGFSSAFYKKLHETGEDFEQFMIPCYGIIEHIRSSSDIDPRYKPAIEKNMARYITSIAKALSIKYIRIQKFEDVDTVYEVVNRYLGADLYMKTLRSISRLCRKSSVSEKIMRHSLRGVVSLYRKFKKVST